MYKIGDYIIYANDGVCEVEDIGVLNIPGIDKQKIYYTLKPVYENGKIFTPVDTNIFMRSLITYEEVQNLIKSIPYIEENKCDEKNSRSLQMYYKNLLQTHECSDLLTLLSGIYDKKAKAMNSGKKLGQIDDRFMKAAEGLINDEFSLILGIPREDIGDYIREKIKGYENKQ